MLVTEEPRLMLPAATVADLMTPSPISLRDNCRIADAVTLLTRKAFHAAPVIDESGRPVGVLSYTDVLLHDRARRDAGSADVDEARVCDLMTPAIFTVPVNASARRAIDEMVGLNVHQLYVVDATNVVVGVLTPLDILRRLTA